MAATPNPEPGADVVDALALDLADRFGPLVTFLQEIYESVVLRTLSWNGAVELTVIALTGIVALALKKPLHQLLERLWPQPRYAVLQQIRGAVRHLLVPSIWLFGLWIGFSAVSQFDISTHLLRLAVSLLNAWILIRLFSSIVRDPFWSNTFATLAWVVAALNILKLLNPTIALLDSVGFSFGEARVTLFMLIKGSLFAAFLVWAAFTLAAIVQSRLARSETLTPSAQTLLSQGARLTLLFAAVMLALNVIGVDLTALAVFSGAIGVGIGFGLQSIFSNLMSGIILLLERSVKIGDFIEFENGLAGEVREINTRATRVTTNDNVDILVPNSEFINNRVTNWTMREGYRRFRIPFGVAYGTDKELVRKAVLEAADTVPHMLTGARRDPQVWLVGFGDSSLDFELVIWLKPESVKRPGAVTAEYNWAIETALGKYGIEIPFPQRDLHIRSGRLPIELKADEDPAAGG